MQTVREKMALIHRIAMKFLNATSTRIRDGGKFWSYEDLLKLVRDTKQQADREGLVLEGLNSLYNDYQADIEKL